MLYISNEPSCSENHMYYVVHVKTGKEEEAIENIKKQLKYDENFDVFSPFRKSLRKYKGSMVEVIERCFPGYIFVETNDPKQLFKALYWTPGYTRLLGREGLTDNFLPLSEEEARVIDILYSKNSDRITEISDIVVHEGQIIRVVDGPLMGLLTSIKKVNLHKRTVTIETTVAGRAVELNVAINIITDLIN